MWEQVKQVLVDSARKVCASVQVGKKHPVDVWWNDIVKAAVERKEVLGAMDEVTKERCMEIYKEKQRMVKRSISEH